MEKQNEQEHIYVLPSGEIVKNQKDGCIKLGIGRNAFRNRVKSGLIKKIMDANKPNGYEEPIDSTLR